MSKNSNNKKDAVNINIRVDRSLKNDVQEICEERDESISQLLRRLLKKWLLEQKESKNQ